MLKIIFYLKAGKTNKKGESPIYAKISYNQDSTTMATGKSISKERWQFTNNLRNVLKLEKEKILKQSLDLFELKIQKKCNEMLKEENEISLLLLKNEFNGKPLNANNTHSFLDILEKHNCYFEKKVTANERSETSLQKYRRSKELLKNFIKKQYKIEDLPIEEINSAFIYNLKSFLKYESNFKGQIGIKNNSVVKYMRMYKTACNYAVKMGLIEKNPFNIYDGKLSVKDAIYLTREELESIENKRFSIERLEKVKDIFLFSCYRGYAPVDALNLTASNLVLDSNDNLWIMTNRVKTAIKANVPLLPPARKIIEKYKNKQIRITSKNNESENECLFKGNW